MGTHRAARQNGGILRLHSPDGHMGVQGLQRLTDAGDGAAGTDTRAEAVDGRAHLLQYLQTGLMPMGLGIGRIAELLGHKDVGIFPFHLEGQLEALLNGVADVAGVVHQHHFGAVMLHELFPLGAYRVGHDDAHLIAKHRTDEGQADALVARGGFDNDGIGTDAALLLGLQNHIICHAGLDGAAHIQTFKLDQHLRTVGGHHTVQADQRRSAHGFQNIIANHNGIPPPLLLAW